MVSRTTAHTGGIFWILFPFFGNILAGGSRGFYFGLPGGCFMCAAATLLRRDFDNLGGGAVAWNVCCNYELLSSLVYSN